MDFNEQLITNQQKTIESLINEIALLRSQLATNEEQHKAQVQQLMSQIANLQETLRTFAGVRFAPSSESSKSRQIQGQIDLGFFNEVEHYSDDSAPEPTLEELLAIEEPISKPRKSRSPRKDNYSNLPIIEELHQVTAEDKACEGCDSQMDTLGKEYVREEIRIIPAIIERIHIYRENYICNECKTDDDIVIAKAVVPQPLFKRSVASPSIVSHIMYQKYVNALPLYRQEKDFATLGLTLKRSVQANWINNSAIDYFTLIFDLLHKELISRDLALSDETPCQVHNEEGKVATSNSYMWIHRSGNDGLPPVILYDYQPSRNGDHAVRFLAGFRGFHQCDGFGGYNKLKDVIRIACLAHIRRKFIEAAPKKKTSEKPTPAEMGVLFCNKLFDLERQFKEDTPELRKAKRLEQSKPVLDAFWDWLDDQNPPGGSNLYRAVTYVRNQKEYMNNFLLDGRIEISNAITENAVRPYALIRKNSLFHDTPKGARASAITCSLIETAKACGLNVQKYLEHLLIKMPGLVDKPAGIEDLLPWSKSMQELFANN
jgi:transposase